MILFAAVDEVARISRFGLVGVFNTALDFTLFNVLTSQAVGLNKIWANTISTTVAMIFSFFVNRSYVFSGHGNEVAQALIFFAVTAFGLYVLQNGIIYLLTSRWQWPSRLVERFTRSRHVPLQAEFVLKNGAKLIGTLVSLVWNYILYGRIVFSAKS